MNSPHIIHIMGASGSGTSTLGRALEAQQGYKWLDMDDIFWLPTNPPYHHKRPKSERLPYLTKAMKHHPRCVLSGCLCGWGGGILPQFDLVVWLQVPTDVRVARLFRREAQEFGAQILPGGNMHDNFAEFLAYSARYDTGDTNMRSFALHEQWVRGLNCSVMVLDGTKPTDELMTLVCSQ